MKKTTLYLVCLLCTASLGCTDDNYVTGVRSLPINPDTKLDMFLNNSEGFKKLQESSAAVLKAQYMAGQLLEETMTYPGYEGYPVKLYEYKTGKDAKTGVQKTGRVYMMNPSAEKLAAWVATAVWRVKRSLDISLMETVLNQIKTQSGGQFPVCGIVYEDMDDKGYYPYLFKDGVTVYAADRSKWATESETVPGNYSCTAEQLDYNVHVTNNELKNYTGIYARICGTTRTNYTAYGGDIDVGSDQPREKRSVKWLEVVRNLYKEAWNSNENKLITAWAKTNLK